MVAPLIVAALPWIASAVGTMLPAIVDAFRSGKSPDEAKKIVEPHRQEIIDRLRGSGMNQSAAEAMADESIKGELEKAQLPEPMNPWLSAALAIGGGIGGYKLGKMGAAKMGGPKMAPMTSKPSPASEEVVEPPGPEEPDLPTKRLGYDGPPVRDAQVIDSPFPQPQMDRRFATDWINEPDFPPPGVTRGRGFSMRDAPTGPFPNVGMSPELANEYAAGDMRKRIYRYEGG